MGVPEKQVAFSAIPRVESRLSRPRKARKLCLLGLIFERRRTIVFNVAKYPTGRCILSSPHKSRAVVWSQNAVALRDNIDNDKQLAETSCVACQRLPRLRRLPRVDSGSPIVWLHPSRGL